VGVLVEQWVGGDPAQAFDLGWGTAVLRGSVCTRTCKTCGASVSGPVVSIGLVIHVVPRPFEHRAGCAVYAGLGPPR
jgi:hypothetical protein